MIKPRRIIGLLLAADLAGFAAAQSLDERLDDDAFLRGLVELGLPEVLEHYIDTHPPSDEVQDAVYRIALERLKLANEEVAPAASRETVERILALRVRLIERSGEDPRRATWMLDQAADLYFDQLRIDGTGLTVLFGLASPEQRAIAERVTSQIIELTGGADRVIDDAVLALESQPGYRDDERLQMKRRRLVVEERERRLPFLRGVGLVLHAEMHAESPSAERALYERAASSLEPLEERLDGVLAARARLFRGLALARMGFYDQGEEQFRAVAADSASSASDVFSARMCGVLSRVQADGPEPGLAALDSIEEKYDDRASLFFRVLIADQRFLLRRALAEGATVGSRAEALRAAFDSYLELLDAAPPRDAETLRPIVQDRLSLAAGEPAPLEELPPIVTIARGERFLRENRVGEGVAMFEAALARSDRTQDEDAAALSGLGRALYAANRPLESIARLTDMASKHPKHPDAAQSIELAASVAAEWVERSPSNAEALSAMRSALSVLLTKFATLPSINRWRFVAGRLAMQHRDYDAAVAAFEGVPSHAVEWLDARFMRAAALRAAAEADEAPRKESRAREVIDAVNDLLTPIRTELGQVDAERRADLVYYLAHLQVMLAGSMLDLSRPEAAIETLESIDAAPGISSSILAAALRVRIAAYQALGRPEDARQQLERFIEAAPAEAGAVLDSMIAHAKRGVEDLIRADRADEARAEAQRELAPLAILLEHWLLEATIDRASRSMMLERAASAYRLADRYQDGLRLYDRLEREQSDAIEVVFGRAECLFGLGGDQLGEAMMLYKRLAAGGREIGHDIYWTSQLRLLQILDAVQRNTHQITPRIEQLRREDETFGGPRYKRQFLALLNKHR